MADDDLNEEASAGVVEKEENDSEERVSEPESAVEKEDSDNEAVDEDEEEEEVAAAEKEKPVRRRSLRGAKKAANTEAFEAMQRDIFGGDSDESSDEEEEPKKAAAGLSSDEEMGDGTGDSNTKVKRSNDFDVVSDADSDEDDEDDEEEAANERLKNIQSQSRKRKRASENQESNPKKRARRTGRKRKPKAISDDDAPAPSLEQPKKKGAGRTKEEIIEAVDGYMRQMMEAQEADETAMAAGQPALNKLALFQKIQLHILHAELQQTFIEKGVLSTLRRWLEPLPDKSLPNQTLREGILQLFSKLSLRYLDSAVLQSSGIGRMAQFYAGHPRENARIKKVAQGLIDTWLRQVYQLTDRYGDTDMQNVRRPSPTVARKRTAPSPSGGGIKGGSFAKKRTSLTSSAEGELKKVGYFIQYPERDNDFRTAPVSTAQAREVAVNQKHLAIKSRLGGMRKPKTASSSYKALLRK